MADIDKLLEVVDVCHYSCHSDVADVKAVNGMSLELDVLREDPHNNDVKEVSEDVLKRGNWNKLNTTQKQAEPECDVCYLFEERVNSPGKELSANER